MVGIGWDVGGWQGSRQAVAIARINAQEDEIEWLGVSDPFRIEPGSAVDLQALVCHATDRDDAESILDTNRVTVAIDAPLAFPRRFRSLVAGNGTPTSVPESEIRSPLAYRDCERWIWETFGKKPLSAPFGMLGNNSSLAMTFTAAMEERGFTLVPGEGVQPERSIIEVYPGLLKKERKATRPAVPEIEALLPDGLEAGDPYDATICAVLALVHAGGGPAMGLPDLVGPPDRFELDEGWIFSLPHDFSG